jgi:hypothetical protein
MKVIPFFAILILSCNSQLDKPVEAKNEKLHSDCTLNPDSVHPRVLIQKVKDYKVIKRDKQHITEVFVLGKNSQVTLHYGGCHHESFVVEIIDQKLLSHSREKLFPAVVTFLKSIPMVIQAQNKTKAGYLADEIEKRYAKVSKDQKKLSENEFICEFDSYCHLIIENNKSGKRHVSVAVDFPL